MRCDMTCMVHLVQNSKEDNPATPPFNKECLPHGLQRPLMGNGATGYCPSDSLEHQPNHLRKGYRHDRYLGHSCCNSVGLASTPKLSSISGAKTETSSVDASVRTSSSPEEVDQSSEISVSVSNASDQEREWIEEDEPGVYITIRALPGGIRELRRVRFRFTVFCLKSYFVNRMCNMPLNRIIISATFSWSPRGSRICKDITARIAKKVKSAMEFQQN